MRAPIPLLLVILVLATPAVSQTPDDTLIVPGVRIGKATLKMAIGDLLRMIGPVSPAFFMAGVPESTPSWRRDFLLYIWPRLNVGALTYDRKKVEMLQAGFGEGALVPYKTDGGITMLRSQYRDILAVYGFPTVMLEGLPGQPLLIYDKIGLGFRIYDPRAGGLAARQARGGIATIYVFRPRTARSFWKF